MRGKCTYGEKVKRHLREGGFRKKCTSHHSHYSRNKNSIFLYRILSYLILGLHYYPLVQDLHVSLRLHVLRRRRNRQIHAILDILTMMSSGNFCLCDALYDLQLKTNNSTSKQVIKVSFNVYRP